MIALLLAMTSVLSNALVWTMLLYVWVGLMLLLIVALLCIGAARR